MAAHSLQPDRAGTIRRVVRRGRHFLCGLCRNIYDREGTAQSCVIRCWSDLLALDPVIPRRHGLVLVHRCRFCARDYPNRLQAQNCASDCKTHQLDLYERELSLLDDIDDAPPPRRFKPKIIQRPVLAPAPRPKTKPAATAEHAGEAESAPISVDSATPAPQPSPEASTGDSAAAATAAAGDAAGGDAGGSKKKTGDMFFRDGARYICNHCKAKHFTKDEVVKCFESH